MLLLYCMVSVHRQRDIIPLDVNDDMDSSDEDDDHPVFNLEVSLFFFWF